MEGGIYLLQDGGLVGLDEQAYEAERVLQDLLAKHPNLLAGDQVDATAPRRWLLVTREASVPGEEGGVGRWALDHLFLDQDAVPTLVEVKRSTDTRVRREVVGQMLDYAANAVVYWPAEVIRAQFEAACEASARDPDEEIGAFLGDDADPDAFWQLAKQNLQAGRIRMIFVADRIPPELQRIVEFLNGQMNTAQVLALEVRQFVGQGLTALVPRVVGQTAAAQQAKSVATKTRPRQWDRASFLADAEARCSREAVDVLRKLFDWVGRQGLLTIWGQGQTIGSPTFTLQTHHGRRRCMRVWSDSGVQILFWDLQHHPAFTIETSRLGLAEKLNQLPGITIPGSELLKEPGFKTGRVADPTVLAQFLGVLDWMVERLRSTDVQN